MLSYKIIPTPSSTFALEVHKTGLLRGRKHQFVFEKYRGDLQLEPGLPEQAQVCFSLEGASIGCRDAWISSKEREKVIATARNDMLAVKEFPQIQFESTRLRPQSDHCFEVEGRLTIRGISRPVSLDVSLRPGHAGHLELSGTATVKLSDYGLKPPSAALGAIGTRDNVTVHFSLEADQRL